MPTNRDLRLPGAPAGHKRSVKSGLYVPSGGGEPIIDFTQGSADAEDLGGDFLVHGYSADRNTNTTVGGEVTSWNPILGTSSDDYAGGTGPTLVNASTMKGYKALRFNGVDTLLTLSASKVGGAYTSFPSTHVIAGWVFFDSSATTYSFIDSATSGNRCLMRRLGTGDGGSPSWAFYNDGDMNGSTSGGTPSPTTEAFVMLSLSISSGAAGLNLNNVSIVGDVSGSSLTPLDFIIGAQNGSPRSRFAEIDLVYVGHYAGTYGSGLAWHTNLYNALSGKYT